MTIGTEMSLNADGNTAVDGVSLTAAGRLFHARDAATGNERPPRVDRRLDGTNRVGDAADRRRRRAATSVLNWRDSARYDGAVPWRHL